MSDTLGQLIRDRRRQKGITQKAFAKLLGEGVHQSDVSRLECGLVRQPRPERLHRIATVLELPVGTLLMLTPWGNPQLTSLGPMDCSTPNDTVYAAGDSNEDSTCFLDSAAD